MYKLMIVDDNPYTCKEILNMLNWSELNIEVLGTYSNSMKALLKVQDNPPDIVLADIRMPVINGIEFAAKLKKSLPEVEIIFMSSYNEFDYSHSAIKLGAAGYLLKPVNYEELLKGILNITKKLDQRKAEIIRNKGMLNKIEEMLPAVKEQFLWDLLIGATDKEKAEKRINELGMDFLKGQDIFLLLLRIRVVEDKSVFDTKLLEDAVYRVAQSEETRKIELLQISYYGYAILYMDNTGGDDLYGKVVNFSTNLILSIEDTFHTSALIGISGESKDYMNLHAMYNQAYQALNAINYGSNNPIVFYDDIDEGNNNVPSVTKVAKDIRDLIRYGDTKEIDRFLDDYFPAGKVNPSYTRDLAIFTANAAVLAAADFSAEQDSSGYREIPFLYESNMRQMSEEGIRQWLKKHFLSLIPIGGKNEQMGRNRCVRQIKKFVEENYSRHLSIQEIASGSVFLSAGYANSIFKKKTGITIFDYLQQCRMQAAKRLLLQSGEMIQEIAEEVGFLNASHFCLTFRKSVGLSPAEYRSKGMEK